MTLALRGLIMRVFGKVLFASLLASIISLAFIVYGQVQQKPPVDKSDKKESPASDKQPVRSPEILALVSDARQTPPEFAADALIRLAGSSKVTDPKWKQELLEEAFHTAASAKQPMRRIYVGGSIDTRTGYLDRSMILKMDQISLQTKAVKAMLAFNPKQARELFEQITLPKMPPLECEETMLYDATDFYAVMTDIVNKSFDAEDRKANNNVFFVNKYIEKSQTLAELGPLAKMIGSLNLTKAQFENVLHSYTRSLDQIPTDNRSYGRFIAASEDYGQLPLLATESIKRGVSSWELLNAMRGLLIKQSSAKICADYSVVPPSFSGSNHVFKSDAQYSQKAVDDFNEKLRLSDSISNREVASINPEDMKPAKVGGKPVYHAYWQSAKAKSLLMKIKALRFSPEGKPYSAEDRQSIGWQTKLNDFMGDLNGWFLEDEETQEDYFHQKCVLYLGLLELTPSGSVSDNTLASFLLFLSESKVREDSPAEWMM